MRHTSVWAHARVSSVPVSEFPSLSISFSSLTRGAARRNPGSRLFVVGISLALCTCGTRDELSPIRDALEAAPGIAPRVSIMTRFRPCADSVSQRGTIPVANCTVLKTRSAPGDAAAALRAAPDSQQLHLAALVDLASADSSGRTLERSISALRRASVLSENPAPVLADLAAALIVRAERNQAPRDLLEAYEVAMQALERSPHDPVALYNRALAVDRFGLVDESIRGWTTYLAADSTSGWARDARQRIGRLRTISTAPPQPGMDSALPRFFAYAMTDPQKARELAMHQLLPRWGEAVAAGETARAEAALARAEALGSALERHLGGDRSVADAVRAIRGVSANRARTAALASAHRAYSQAMATYDSGAFERAGPRLAEVVTNAAASPALVGWARVYLETTRAHLGPRAEALARLGARAEDIDASAYPAMAARARWSLGTTLTRAERWESGLEEMMESARLFERAGERENVGAALNTAIDARFVLGESDSAYAAVHRGLSNLRPYRASLRLHNLLGSAADRTAIDGLPRAAILLANEDVSVSGRLPPQFIAEAMLRRTRHLAAVGDSGRARADLDRAQQVITALDSSYLRDWYRADLAEARATAGFTGDPGRKAAALDSAAAFFTSFSLSYRLLPVQVGAAEARLAAGDPADAARRLEAVMRLLEHRRDSIGMEPRRAAAFDAARHVVDRLVMLKLAGGRETEALGYLDRARASLAMTGTTAAPGPSRSRPGEVAVEYALVADTLLVWTLADGPPRLARTVIDTLQLLRTLQGLEVALEAGAGEATVRPALARLHEWLVRPVEGRLGSTDTPLVLVLDGTLAAVPFAALFDAHRGRYLAQDHPLRFAVSLVEASRPAPPLSTPRAPLFVADPAFDPRANPLLDSLPNALAEVERIAGAYSDAVRLEGSRASRAAVASALPRATLFHFAGHAVFDDARPERSYLVLAPTQDDAVGRLTAADLARLDLSYVRLVVLSACRTMRTGGSRAAGYSGLSGALLAAGAGGTVGSTWNVDDRSTGKLMAAFHNALRGGLSPQDALRDAQLRLLRSGDPRLRTPAAWAGFRYAGR